MSNRLIVGAKVACAVLGIILALQLVRFAAAKDPLANLNIPTPPNLSTGGPTPAAPKATGATNTAGRVKPPAKAAEVAPATTARIEQIKDTEVFGALPKPLPMALLGIIGMEAIIRGANGQTGLVREGDEFAGVKVLRLGTNRVLVEHEGEKKELTVFAGFGSETLMPSGKETVP